MNSNNIRFLVLFFLPLWLLSGFGCSGLTLRSSRTNVLKAETVVDQIRKINKEIQTCKGKGWLTLSKDGKKEKFRIAWAAKIPDKIRMTLLSAGHPVETIIADGQSLWLISHTGKHLPHKIDDPDPSLSNILSIPVKPREIIALFAGQVPLQPYDSVYLLNEELSGETIVVFKKKWVGTVARLFINSRETPFKLQRIDKKGNPVYTIRFDRFNLVTSYSIPFLSVIEDSSDRHITLEITDYKADTPINDTVFILTES